MKPIDFLKAARVPKTLEPQTFGPWTIQRRSLSVEQKFTTISWPDYTLLFRPSLGSLHHDAPGDVVMEDSPLELSRHLPIWLAARGRVLVTGLGLGCVVRGLLASPEVEHIDVVEIHPDIIRIIGAEFAEDPRVNLIQNDALKVNFFPGTRWDYAWHDLWEDGSGAKHLQLIHAKLILKYQDCVRHQGAWGFPRFVKRIVARKIGDRMLGAAKYPDTAKMRCMECNRPIGRTSAGTSAAPTPATSAWTAWVDETLPSLLWRGCWHEPGHHR